jgi:N-acetylneuraminate synthase
MTARIVAEVGCNHKGEMEIAREMIMIAATVCKVDVVKFQKRTPRELLSEAAYNAPHPNPYFAYGPTYGAHREALEFSLNQHKLLKGWCEQFGAEYSTSVWDVTAAREMIAVKPKFLKVPSACNQNLSLLNVLADEFDGEIHVSLGMTTREEEERLVGFFEEKGRASDLVLYSCTSGYPVAFDEINLLEITRIQGRWQDRVKAVGFSGHHLGIAADIAAVTLGVEWVERHFTLDRTWRGTDHAASLEPDGLRRLTRDVRNVAKAMQLKSTEILPVESVQRDKLKQNQIRWTL